MEKTDKNIQDRFIKALVKSKGIISTACRAVGINRQTFYNWRDRDDKEGENFRKRVEEVMELQGDFVETKLLDNIENGDVTSVIFYCKTKLRNRGYNQVVDTNVNIESVDDITVESAVDILKQGLQEEN